MSILTKKNKSNQPSVDQVAERIKSSAFQASEQMLNSWNQTFDMLWREGGAFTPAEKLEALGTEAAELFQLSAAMVEFMINNLSGKRDDALAIIAAKVSSMPALTINSDGTVTID